MTGEAVVDGRLALPPTQKIYHVYAWEKTGLRVFLILLSSVFEELN